MYAIITVIQIFFLLLSTISSYFKYTQVPQVKLNLSIVVVYVVSI
jgi:hypothetical protein